jgi:hypothetical protein
VIGVIEQAVSFNTGSAGPVSMILFVLILVALLLQSREGSRERERGSWLSVQPWRPLPEPIARLRTVRAIPSCCPSSASASPPACPCGPPTKRPSC